MSIWNAESISDRADWNRRFGLYLHRRRLEILRSLLRQYRFLASLDIGCGEGLLSTMGLRNPVGIDVHPGNGVSIIASAEYLPFKPQCFDLVFAGEVIEHLDRPLAALRDWVRVLKPKGSMILSTPNGILVNPYGNPEHKRTFAPRDIMSCLGKLGLTVTSTKGIFVGLISGRRLFKRIPFDSAKMLLLRLPVPLWLSYDVFIKLRKYPGNSQEMVRQS